MPLQKELESLINCHCAENESDTPDFILAAYLSDCLAAFNRSVNMREAWYGRKTQDVESQNKSDNTDRLKCPACDSTEKETRFYELHCKKCNFMFGTINHV